jgi:hypothetical protein
MPSRLHESHLLLFRNHPALAAELIRAVRQVSLPQYTEARVLSADFTDIQPAEYRADMAIQFRDKGTVFGIVLEVQLSQARRKRFVWPVYVSLLRARLECPVELLVVTPDESSVARWAARPIEIGRFNTFTPVVVSPSGIPALVDEDVARANPELAVLSAMAHGSDENIDRAARIALCAHAAISGLDGDRSKLYCDLDIHSLSEAARNALRNMDARAYEYQSDFARQYVAQGREEGKQEGRAEGKAEGKAEGEASGRAALISRLLTVRFGPLGASERSRIHAASIAELDAIGERLLTANTLDEALGSLG